MNNQFTIQPPAQAIDVKLYYREQATETVDMPVKKDKPKSTLYLTIMGVWIASLCWFEPRLLALLPIADTGLQYFSLVLFIIFIDFAWLYGIYNICIVCFAAYYRLRQKNKETIPVHYSSSLTFPPVALLYTTCNDFSHDSALSCLQQDYPNYSLYILDDSTDEAFKKQIDQFALLDVNRIVVVRRSNRMGFKAGNLNHALTHVANTEKYFAIADADEILPVDFLTRLVPIMEQKPTCGFVQANHRANPSSPEKIQKDMGVGINTHWKWYQPLRNEYGFVMFLGHGALLRYDCWKMIGGFPDIVSEDLGFAIAAREKGFRGWFESSVTCYEDFPDSVQSFRTRHMKWTRGTCEFLHKKMWWLLKAKNISAVEKADILFPTLNLPLTLLFFIFMINTNLLLPAFFGYTKTMTVDLPGLALLFPVTVLDSRFAVINAPDFYFITVLTFFAPVLCFILAMRTTPRKLFVFLCHSTALYASLSLLSAIGVITYIISGKAVFLVTGDKTGAITPAANNRGPGNFIRTIRNGYTQFLQKSHPATLTVQFIEILLAVVFLIAGLKMMQLSFFGLCLSFLLLPVLHHTGWDKFWVRPFIYLPFILIIAGVLFSTMSVMGMQSVFFGYGFHF